MKNIYDLAGIGIGPFNLGLAALGASIGNLSMICFDKKPGFSWHPGMMLETATLQVAFYADLVTLADPTSPFSFLAYLKAKGRMIPFGILEEMYITRRAYAGYCRWVAEQLPALHFGRRVDGIYFDPACHCYRIRVWETAAGKERWYYARRLVLGTGTVPRIPGAARDLPGDKVFHSSEYLYRRDSLRRKKSITLIGSGQSAAEIMHDLLSRSRQTTPRLHWFTRSARFYPMDYSRLTLEMSTPDYIDYFYNLPPAQKERLLAGQNTLYKGINYRLIHEIYKQLYTMTLEGGEAPARLHTGCELNRMEKTDQGRLALRFCHRETGRSCCHETDAVILATGYRYAVPACIEPVRDRIHWDDKGRYRVRRNYSIDKKGNEIFVQNAELHTHGFNAPDLSLGPYRNAIILKEITGHDFKVTGTKSTFQDFGIPRKAVAGEGLPA